MHAKAQQSCSKIKDLDVHLNPADIFTVYTLEAVLTAFTVHLGKTANILAFLHKNQNKNKKQRNKRRQRVAKWTFSF